ncbi:MAG: hypothetical protein HY422_03185, partial [Candidatus Komeilibacteria bacterium]|nr:hypothetical protein [Candidatus Komeilibacteria bacterium]
SIAWSGSEFGVAQSTINVPTWDIRLTRYDGLGTSVTTTLAGNTSCSSYYPQLTWTGSEYGVIWADCTAANNDWEIYFSRLDRSGKKIGQDLRLTNAVGFSAYPSIAWNGDEYGFVWHDRRYDSGDILFARINRYGYKIGTDVRLTTHPSSSQSPFITWTGSEYGVTWYDYRDGNYEVYFTRMDRTGVKIGSDIRVTTNAYQSYNPVLSWNGNGYGISWYDTRNGSTEIYFAKLSPDGTKLTPDIRITNASDSSMYPSLSWTGSAYGLAWYDRRDGNNEIYFTMLDVNGVKLQIDQRLTTDAGNSQYPALRWTGSRFGLAWLDNRTGASEVYFTSITCN